MAVRLRCVADALGPRAATLEPEQVVDRDDSLATVREHKKRLASFIEGVGHSQAELVSPLDVEMAEPATCSNRDGLVSTGEGLDGLASLRASDSDSHDERVSPTEMTAAPL